MSRFYELLQNANGIVSSPSRIRNAALPESGPTLPRPNEIQAPAFAEEDNGQIPTCVKLPCADIQPSEKRDLMKVISSVFHANDLGSPHVVAVASVDGSVSSGRIAARCAELLSEQTAQRVCVVDADLHNGSLHRQFGLDSREGLNEALSRDDSIRNYCVRVSRRLSVLCAGDHGQGSRAYEPWRLRMRVAELRREFMYCLIVTPPLANSEDAVVLGALVDGVMLVVGADTTRGATAAAVKDTLTKAEVPIFGVILYRHTLSLPAWLQRRL